MANKTDYKAIAIQAAVTAVIIAGVNWIMKPVTGALGAAETTLLNFPLENMAQFSDMATKVNVNNENFLRNKFSMVDIDDPITYKTGSKITIGNCAFVALYSKHQEFRDLAMLMLENYKKYAA